jgi:uncharacterized membrane protein (DUF2068 family)
VRASRSLLSWIVAFKAFKTLTLAALGVVLLAARRTDAVEMLTRAALAVHLPLTSHVFERAVRFATDLTVRKETALAFAAFGYAALMGAEGIGLHLRKPWARWFTVIATGSLLPIEIYEIFREPHLIRVLILIANAAVVVYLARRRDLFESR